MTNFAEIVDAADNLTIDEQQSLTGILQHRIAEQNRLRMIGEVAEARAEHAAGQARSGSVADLMDEIRHNP